MDMQTVCWRPDPPAEKIPFWLFKLCQFRVVMEEGMAKCLSGNLSFISDLRRIQVIYILIDVWFNYRIILLPGPEPIQTTIFAMTSH
jgi:hypothetical protein